MRKIAIVTDSNSGIGQKQAEELGCFVIAMPVIIDDKTYYEGIDIDRENFYARLSEDCNVSTAQALPGDIVSLWKDLLETHDEIVYIPMSSSLSRSYETALMLSNEFHDRVQVVDNQRISVIQRQSVIDALEMANLGMDAITIKKILEEDKLNASIYISLDTLKYLKKGGRITPAVATIGSLLKIKPVLQIQGGLLDSFAKARTIKSGKKIIIDQIKDDMVNRFNSEENEVLLQIAHTCKDKEAEIFQEELKAAFPGYSIYLDHLPLSIACHTGPGALGLGVIKKLKVESHIYEKSKIQAL